MAGKDARQSVGRHFTVDQVRRLRLEAFVKIARAALIERELQHLLSRTTKLLQEMLDVDLVEVLEKVPQDGWLVIQGTGWKEGIVGDTVVGNGDSPMGLAAKQTEALVLSETDVSAMTSEVKPPHWPAHNIRSSALIRIGEKAAPWGILALHSHEPRIFHPEELALIEDLGDLLGHAVQRQNERSLLKNETRRAVEARDEVSALYRASRTILEGSSLATTLRAITEEGRTILGADNGLVAQADGAVCCSQLLAAPEGQTPEHIEALLEATIRLTKADQGARPVWRNTTDQEASPLLPLGGGIKNILVAPVRLGPQVVAFLAFANRKGGFTSRDAAVASSFASLTALAVDRAEAWQQARAQRRLAQRLADLALDALKPFDLPAIAARTLGAIESETSAKWGLVVEKDEDDSCWVVAADEQWSPSPAPRTSGAVPGPHGTLSVAWSPSKPRRKRAGVPIDPSGTMLGFALSRGRTVLVDAAREGDQPGLPGSHPQTTNLLIVPIQSAGRIQGAVVVADLLEDRSADVTQIAEMLVRPLALAIQAAQEEEHSQQLEVQLRRAQRLESVGRLAGGVAHDFNNLLTAIMSYTDMAIRQLGSDHPVSADLEQVLDASERAATLTGQLLAFSRRQVLSPKKIDINEIVGSMEGLLRNLLGEDIAVAVELGENPGLVLADPTQIEQVLMNLVVNAKDAMPQGGRLIIETDGLWLDETYCRKHGEVSPGRYTMLAVTDTGMGMDAETLAQIFDPFFTTKEPGKGTGLGLSTVYGIVKQSGGSVWCYSEQGRGTTFKVYLPTVDGLVESPANKEGPLEDMSGTETILLAEDEASVRQALARMLEQAGYEVLTAENGKEALELARRHAGPIHLLITDVIMPGMNGRKLAERLNENRTVQTLYVSGYTDNAVAHAGILDKDIRFLAKPFSRHSLLRAVRQALTDDDQDETDEKGRPR